MALQNAAAVVYNHMESYAAWLAHAEKVLGEYADYLEKHDLLLKDELPPHGETAAPALRCAGR